MVYVLFFLNNSTTYNCSAKIKEENVFLWSGCDGIMGNFLHYKNYVGTVEYSAEDDCLFGTVLGLQDTISYEGTSLKELKDDFANAIEDYLDLCKTLNKEPEKPYNGLLPIKISPALHQKLDIYSHIHQQPVDVIVEEAIRRFVQ